MNNAQSICLPLTKERRDLPSSEFSLFMGDSMHSETKFLPTDFERGYGK